MDTAQQLNISRMKRKTDYCRSNSKLNNDCNFINDYLERKSFELQTLSGGMVFLVFYVEKRPW